MLLFLSLVVFAAPPVFSSDVIEAGDSNFESELKGRDIALVEFFAPWCGHCKRLAPEYETAATKLKREDPPIPLVKVDCTEAGKETCGKYGVSGYPTLKIFRNGEFSKDYDGPRDASGIVSTMQKQAGPSSKEITTPEQMKKFVEGFNAGVVAFLQNDKDLEESFLRSADEQREKYRFAHTSSEEIMKEYGFRDEIVLFRPPRLHNKFEPNHVKFTGLATLFYIGKFIKEQIHGMVGHMTGDNQDQFQTPLCVVYYKVDYKLNPKGTNYWRNRVLKVAAQFKNRVMHYAIADVDDFSNQLQEFGVQVSGDDPVATIKSDDGSKFSMKDKFSVDTLKDFLNDYFGNKLEPHIKSETIPENNDGPVKVVVGTTFNEIVNDPTKDVLIEFYAPWCGHCKSLEPKYNELGEKLKVVPGIVIAKMDATANDVPAPFDVRGFPTIYWSPKDSKKNPKKYTGGREVPDFIRYLKKEGAVPFALLADIEEPKKKKKSKKEPKKKEKKEKKKDGMKAPKDEL